MALFRKFFYKKPPDGLLEISERVYVFDCCFTTDILEDDEYKVYISNIVYQLGEHSPDASYMVFNFREGMHQSQISSILSEYDMTVMEYPRHYEGCPLLTMEMIHHFLRSSENWLSLGQQNVLLMHCERGGWPILAFMLAALLLYRKQFTGEQKTLDMIYKQAPRELLQLMSPLNPLSSQLRYLQYVSRRNVGVQWPPLDRALTLDCIILRVIPNMDGGGGCRPIFRIYGPDPFMASDRTPKVLFAASKKGKHVRLYNQADTDLIKLDIHCHVHGDVVMECISLDGDQEREQMMFRVMFNTAFIRSNILMLNRDEIDTLWDAKDQFPKDFRVEVLFSEMDSSGSVASIELPTFEDKDGLPMEAFAKVQEFFSEMDWLEIKPKLQNIVALQSKSATGSPHVFRRDSALPESTHEKVQSRLQVEELGNKNESTTADTTQEHFVSFLRPSSDASSTGKRTEPYQPEFSIATMLSTEQNSEVNTVKKLVEPHDLQVALQQPARPKIISQRVHHTSLSPPSSSDASSQGSSAFATRYQAPFAVGITALLHDHSPSSVDEVVRPVSASLPSSTISSPVTNIPKTVHLSGVSSPRMPPPPPPPPQHPTSLASAPHSLTSNVIDSFVGNGEVLRTFPDTPQVPPSPVSPDPAASPSPAIKHSSSAPIPSPPPLPSFSRGSKLPGKVSQVSSSITNAPPPPPLPPAPFSPLKPPSPTLKSSSVAPPPSSPSLPSFSRGSRLPAIDKSPLATTIPESSPLIIDNVLLNAPSPPGHSLSETPQTTLRTGPPAPPPPPHSPVVSPSVSSSISSPRGAKNSAIPVPPPPPAPSQTNSVAGLASWSSVPSPPPPPLKSVSNDPPSNNTAQPPPVPTPPVPFAKGLSRSSSASAPARSTVNDEKVPAVPMPPPSAAFNQKSRSFPRANLRNQAQTKKANLKPYHWLKLSRAMQGSLWAEAQKCDETDKPPEFDLSELESLFSAATPSPESPGGKSSRRTSGPKPDKVQLVVTEHWKWMSPLLTLFVARLGFAMLIELRRAYNCEIMLSKVKVPLGDLMSSVLALDGLALDVDQVDNLIKFCPTKEETELLKGYTGDKQNLGRCEQFFLELMKVPRVESKLRVFSYKLQFHHQVSDLGKNLNVVNSASEEIRGSAKLKRIMQTILSLGNALNQGTARGSAVGFRLDSLLKLTDTRARNNKMTLMHYLCKVLAEKLPELLEFPKDLTSLEAATKIQLKYLAEEMQAISKGLEKVVQELSASENDGPVSETFRQTLKAFLSSAEIEVRFLTSLYSTVGRNADALALYFGEDPARCSFEQVVSTLQNFVRMFVRAHEENRKQLEMERKKAEKETENEKLKIGTVKNESENLIRTPIRSGNIS